MRPKEGPFLEAPGPSQLRGRAVPCPRSLPSRQRASRARGSAGLGLWGPDPPSLLQFMTSRGNHVARATFESKVPPFYYRPSASDCQ